jgi:DNA-binding NtrC family response regulator
VDIRVVAATNRDLADEIARNAFREDLYYRLNVVALNAAPLRDRKEDIPLLARFFIKRFASEYSPVKDISKQAFIYLQNHDWPGNIRELENVIRRAMALARGESIQPEDLTHEIYTPSGSTASQDIEAPQDDSMEAYEMTAIRNALSKCSNSRRKAAQILKISEATLYRKINKYGIKA